MEREILKCNDLHKSFGKKEILKDISFKLNSGDILAFIGPNGSGKTTTIKLILGLQTITSGSLSINGYDIEKDFVSAIKNVGAIVENPDLYLHLTGYDNLKLAANLYENITKERITEVIKLVKLENRINDKVNKYSLGMRQRLGIAQAILHHPNLLILDEPTNGLDPEGIKELRELLKHLAEKENMGIFISSHNLAELESFCNKVCIIKNGKIIETASVKEFKKEQERTYFLIECNNINKVKKLIKDIIVVNDNIFKIAIEKESIPNLIRTLIENNIDVYTIIEQEMSLEEAFLKRTGGNIID